MKPSKEYPVICWWSGGITSAVACKIAIDTYGVENCRVIMLDTKNEDNDTYRFKIDCESWYGKPIETLTVIGKKFDSIIDIWEHFLSLNVATGAICSSVLKRDVRQDFQRRNKYSLQVFGFEKGKKEENRAKELAHYHPLSNPVFPLIEVGLNKRQCIAIVQAAGIKVPDSYLLGFSNNNCLGTGCIQGGIGYWQKMQVDFPDKFLAMAMLEHRLTDEKGQPVTCLKDQSKKAKELAKGNKGSDLVFLLPHPEYPNHKDLSMMKGRKIEPVTECNGFCGARGGRVNF